MRERNSGARLRLRIFFLSFILVMCSLCLSLYGSTQSPIIVSAQSGSTNRTVVVVDLNVPIDQGSNGLMSRSVETAASVHASALIIDMNTPGGLLSDMLSMISSINSSIVGGIPVYTYVGPDALAASAGSYIAMSTKLIFMGNGSQIGPSTPIVVGGSSLQQNHTEEGMLSLMEGLALENGRNVSAVNNMVVNDIAYPYNLALQYHIADRLSNSLSQTLSILNLTGSSILTVSENVSEQLVSILSNSIVDGILFLIGIIAIVLDFLHPTILLSIAGAVLIALAFIGAEAIEGPTLSPTVAVPIVFFALAAALIILELKTGHGFFLFGGVIVGAIATLLLSYEIPYSPSPIGELQYVEIALFIIFGGFIAIYVRWVGKTIRKRPVTGAESMIGKVGTVVSDLTPTGEVSVEGIIWRARSAIADSVQGPRRGDRVRITGISGLELVVEPAQAKEKAQLRQ